MLRIALVNILYNIGHIISIPMLKYESLWWLHYPYNWCMLKSYSLDVNKELWVVDYNEQSFQVTDGQNQRTKKDD